MRKPDRLKFLSRAQVRELLDAPRAAGRLRDYFLLSLMYYGAMREVEATNMRAEYIDVEQRELLVPTAKRKTRRGVQVCPYSKMPLVSVPILFGDKVLAAAKQYAPAGWLFPGQLGKPITTRQVRYTFAYWAKVVKLDPRVSAHSLRHSAGTHVHEAVGDDLVLIRDFMRHTNVQTTSVYLHTTPTGLNKARAAMKALRD